MHFKKFLSRLVNFDFLAKSDRKRSKKFLLVYLSLHYLLVRKKSLSKYFANFLIKLFLYEFPIVNLEIFKFADVESIEDFRPH